MPPPFPDEIWLVIIRHAVSRDLERDAPLVSFYPLSYNFELVKGFVAAHPDFARVSGVIKEEFVNESDLNAARQASDRLKYCARSLCIEESYTGNIQDLKQVTLYEAVQSLFLVVACPFPLLSSIFAKLLTRSCMLSLTKLTIGMRFDVEGAKDDLELEVPLESLKELTIINCNARGNIDAFPTPTRAAQGTARVTNVIHSLFRKSQKLRLLKMYIHFDSEGDWSHQALVHLEYWGMSPHESLTARTCQFCFAFYPHNRARNRRKAISTTLARTFPMLEMVAWLELWDDKAWTKDTEGYDDGRGMSVIKITREGDEIGVRNTGKVIDYPSIGDALRLPEESFQI